MFDLFRKSSGITWLVVFLGNPGQKYENTRHNAGFMTGDVCAQKFGASIDRLRFAALTGTCRVGGEQVLLMKPQTFMNLSGDAVIQAVKYYKIPPEHVIVVSDEIALPIGKIRVRPSGSAGGHNGLKSIIARLGTEDFPRVRLGVGAPPSQGYDMADWVLSGFHGQDAAAMADAAKRAADAVECYIVNGPDKAMNLFN